MPCRSDYLDPTPLEIQASRLYCLRDEVVSGNHVNPSSCEWEGHGRGYGYATQSLVDNLTEKLCEYCTGKDISHHSLELQIWWRDHQRWDKKDSLSR